MATNLEQIINLRIETNRTARGRLFEALIREIMPWDERPPIVMSPSTEQLDGVFVYKNLHFLIESKAIKKTITPGMHEWEDYELKLRRRNRQVVGLFCSLFPVSDDTIKRGDSLNENGYTNIIIHDQIWIGLQKYQIDFPSYLDYLVLLARVKLKSFNESFDNFNKWFYDSKMINDSFTDVCKKSSSSFLSRFRHNYHEKIYVKREIDSVIASLSDNLKPNSLLGGIEKESPKQIIIIRDFSGSGKTTLSVNLSLGMDLVFSFGTTASGNEVDKVFEKFLESAKFKQNSLSELKAVNKPLVYVIDSLDEVPKMLHNQKRSEVKSLLKRVKELNDFAVIKYQLRAFPILVIFTIREDYWRDWEAVFEGRKDVVELKKRINNFTFQELDVAITKYSNTYNYRITNELNKNCKEILSIPINLEMFSEANEFRGNFSVEDIWEGKILHSFFKKKEENIFKHYIEGFTPSHFYDILGLLAYSIITDRKLIFTTGKFKDLLAIVSSDIGFLHSQILQLLVSEQIISSDKDNARDFRFRYIRFVEYLVALHIVKSLEVSHNFLNLEIFIHTIYESNIVSIHSILSNIKNICKTSYPELEQEIAKHYENSSAYLTRHLPYLRGLVSRGEVVEKDDLKVLIAKNYTHASDITWETFFIISAKLNKQPKSIIISAFSLAWETNVNEKTKRFKLIDKLAHLGLLLEEKVFVSMLNNSVAKDWETLLGFAITKKMTAEFIAIWNDMNCSKSFRELTEVDLPEWNYASKLLEIALGNKPYVKGDIFETVKDRSFIDLTREKKQSKLLLSEPVKNLVDEFLLAFKNAYNHNHPIPYYLTSGINNLNSDGNTYLNSRVNEFIEKENIDSKYSFLVFLIDGYENFSELLKVIIHSKLILDVNLNDKFGKTLLQSIYESEITYVAEYYEFLFSNNYVRNDSDEIYIRQLENDSLLSDNDLERIILAKFYYKVTSPTLVSKIPKVERILFSLYSIINNRIVSFRFSNVIQVVNNALEHYKEYRDLIIQTLVLYDRYDEFSQKESFRKKIEQHNQNKVVQTSEYDDIISLVFPGLI